MSALPLASSPDLILAHSSVSETHETHLLSSFPWAGALTKEQYFENEQQLASYLGITHWILTQKDVPENERLILASCETIRKQCLIKNGEDAVRNRLVIGVAGVFCEEKLRGRGYAGRMLRELVLVLPRDGELELGREGEVVGSFLWSDIGPKFYADLGWKPFPSRHIELPASRSLPKDDSVATRAILADDIASLCADDEALLRASMVGTLTPKTLFAILPNHKTMLWHHQKEEYICEKLFGKVPDVKGAIAGEYGNRVWTIWTRGFNCAPDDPGAANKLYILRLVIENFISEDLAQRAAKLEAVLEAAQCEAAEWKLGHVELWNLDQHVRDLIVRTSIKHRLVEREIEGIPSLLWFVDGNGSQEGVEWIASEKFAWC